MVLVVAGIALGLVSIREQRSGAIAEGQGLFAQLSTGDDPKTLLAALSTRRAFLDQVLSSDAAAHQFLRHQHALSIAFVSRRAAQAADGRNAVECD